MGALGTVPRRLESNLKCIGSALKWNSQIKNCRPYKSQNFKEGVGALKEKSQLS